MAGFSPCFDENCKEAGQEQIDGLRHGKDSRGISRRSFLAGVGGTVAIELLVGRSTNRVLGYGSQLDKTSQDIADAFLLQRDLAYMNNGSLGPCPRSVMDATNRAWQRLEQNPADIYFGPILQEMEQVRAKVAKFMGCDVSELAITRNTTEAMNTVAQGLGLQAGQHVLTTDHEHPGGLVGWEYLARTSGIIIDRIRLDIPPQGPWKIIQQIDRAIHKNTRVISISHVTCTTGLRTPIREIADLARSRSCLLVVDGAQVPGSLRVNLRQLGCHAYATSAHKWLLSPKGTGLLYISREAQEQIQPMLLQNGMEAYTASTGTRNAPAIIGLGAAVDFLQSQKPERIEQRVLQLRNLTYECLARIKGVRLLSPPASEMASAMATFALRNGADITTLVRRLREKYNIVVKVVSHSQVNGIRVSTHIYNNEEHIERLVRALSREL